MMLMLKNNEADSLQADASFNQKDERTAHLILTNQLSLQSPRMLVPILGDAFKYVWFSPLGKWSNLTNMFFQMGWNHQLE